MDITINSNIPAQKLRDILSSLPSTLSGRNSSHDDIRRVFTSHFVHKLFSLLLKSYIARANGGTDSLGNRWKPLADSTLARKARTMQLGAVTEFNLLTQRQLDKWQQEYNKAKKDLSSVMPTAKAEAMARRIAWKNSRSRIPIGVHNGDLIRACRPGTISGDSYTPPDGQFLSESPGRLIIGLDVDHAKFFNKARKIWPRSMKSWVTEAAAYAARKTAEHLRKYT